MNLQGRATLQAPLTTAWAALTSPAVLASTIPGCEDVTPTGAGPARLTLTTKVASTKATYSATVTRLQHQPPHHLSIQLTLTGEPGTLTATAGIHLTESGPATTELGYEANADVTGTLAAVGQSLLQATLTRLITTFLERLNEHLASQGTPAQASAEPGRSPVGAAGVASPTPAPTPRASAPTAEPEPGPRQPVVTRGAARAPQPAVTFALGAITGAAISTLWSRRNH